MRDSLGRFVKGHANSNYGRTHFTKSLAPWNKGVSSRDDSRLATSERHGLWKGDKAGYIALHSWVERKLGRPQKCDKCGTGLSKRFEWHNIDGRYERDLNGWERLCTTCHAIRHKFLPKGISKMRKQTT